MSALVLAIWLTLFTLASLAVAQPLPELQIMQQHERSWWRYFQVRARTRLRASPGGEGTGVDTRAALEFVMLLGDVSGELAMAQEQRRQHDDRQAHTEKIEQRRLAYERKRAALRAKVMLAFAALRTAQVEFDAMQAALGWQREREAIVVKRVASGVVTRGELWALTDEIAELERQGALLAERIEQGRMALALLAGDEWRECCACCAMRGGKGRVSVL